MFSCLYGHSSNIHKQCTGVHIYLQKWCDTNENQLTIEKHVVILSNNQTISLSYKVFYINQMQRKVYTDKHKCTCT